jgi:sugar (pentulose or hexulose) kinase
MSGDRLLSLDVGTQSARALLFDAAGNLLAGARLPLPVPAAPRPGWAELDPEVFWDTLADACQALWRQGARPDGVAGVALTTQRGTTVALDAEGRALRPAIVWLDTRRTRGLPRIGGAWGLALRLAGASSLVAYFQAEAEANWIRVHEPDVWRRTRRYLLLSGYLTHKLVGRYVDSSACQVGYIPFDYRRHRWASPRDWKWQAVPMDPAVLPELVPPASALGAVTREAAERTGIPAGLPLVAAAADKACEILGAGCLEPHQACLSYGTTATINTIQRRFVGPWPFFPPYPAPVPGAYAVEVHVPWGYRMVSWFKDEFGQPERARASAEGVEVETLFDELVAQVPPGCLGLTLKPSWGPGIKTPTAKGAIVGFGGVHTRAHFYRAILEGIAYALREGQERIERRTGARVTELHVCGGGSRSDAALRLTADVFGLPAARPHVFEASGLGAAVIAAVGLGLHRDFAPALAAMTRVGAVVEPDPATHHVYDGLYRRVYRRLHRALAPVHDAIAALTGYPEPV